MPYIGKSPANVPVTAEDIPNNSITAAKIVDNAITISDIGPNAVGNSEMADDAVGVSELSASGSPGSTTFLRGDNAWATPGVTTVNNVTGAVTAVNIRDAVESATNSHTFNDGDHTKLNAIENNATADQTNAEIKTAVQASANIALGGNPTTTTQAESDDSTRIATTAYVVDKITTLIGGAPSTLNDLNELALAINDDASYNSTLTTALATKMPKSGGAFTGNVTTNGLIDGRDVAADGVLATNALPKAGGTLTGDLILGDGIKLELGNKTGGDLAIYHDGSHSYVRDGGTGDLLLQGRNSVKLQDISGENYFVGTVDGSAELYHNNAIRLQTNSTGIQLGMDGTLDGGIVSAIHSLFFNIDSDNNSSGQQIRFATNHSSGASGGNTLLSIQEDGRGLSQFTAKAWVNFNGENTPAIRNSHNVSSVTDQSVGKQRTAFTVQMANDQYSVSGTANWRGCVCGNDYDTNYLETITGTFGGADAGADDYAYVHYSIFGD